MIIFRSKTNRFLLLLIAVGATLAVVAQASEPACASAPSGLVSWWKGEGNTLDSVDGNSGLAVANLSYASGKVGQAFYFSGTNGHIKVPASSNLNVGLGSGLTVEGWINPSDASTDRPICEWNNGTGTPG